jgi:predicted O-methyltransferase YrrM
VSTMTIEAARQRTRGVEGWLTDREGEALFRLARDHGKLGAVVEIGSWKGRSTIWLACGQRAGTGGKVVAIDPHTGSTEHQTTERVWTFHEFQHNVSAAGVADLVEPLVMTSREAASMLNQPVGLIFIDGAHDYEAVRADFEAWFPKVVDGGVMAFNDADSWPDVFQLVRERVVRSQRFRRLRLVDSTLIAQKVGRNTFADRARNRYVFLLVRVSFRSRRLQLPKGLVRIGKQFLRLLQASGKRS